MSDILPSTSVDIKYISFCAFLLSVMTPGEDFLIVVEEYFSTCHAYTHSYTFEYIMDGLFGQGRIFLVLTKPRQLEVKKWLCVFAKCYEFSELFGYFEPLSVHFNVS